MIAPELDPSHARRVAWLFGLDVGADTPVTVLAAPTRRPDRAAAWRDAALRTPPGGLLLAALDVQPGDHLFLAVREQSQLHLARHGGDPLDAVRLVTELSLEFTGGAKTAWREWLERVRDGLDRGAPWVERLVATDLHPGTLLELVAEAAPHELAWLCDARLANSSLALLPRVARAFADDDVARCGDRVRGEQLADLVRNQFARIGLFVRGASIRAPSVDLDRVEALSWIGAKPEWSAWALEPLDERAEAELRAADTPSATEGIVDALGRASGPMSYDQLRDIAGADDQAVSSAVVAAWALGFARPAGELP